MDARKTIFPSPLRVKGKCRTFYAGFPDGAVLKNLPANARDIRDAIESLGWEDPLEKEMVSHSNILAWKIP